MNRRAIELTLVLVLLALLAGGALAGAEVIREGSLQVAVSGGLSPKRLPRSGTAPIAVSVGGKITTTDKSSTPRLKTLSIELNRSGHLDSGGLAVCPYGAIQPASTQRALSACRPALVGQGSFQAEISLAGQDPYPTSGRLLAFNGRQRGRPVLYGQIYAPRPFATSFVIVFSIGKSNKGAFGTILKADLAKSLGGRGKLTGIELTLSRKYSHGGERLSYLSAGCPAPKGFPGASFPFAKTTFGFEGGRTLQATLTRNCRVRS
jgi:hypothetical protein